MPLSPQPIDEIHHPHEARSSLPHRDGDSRLHHRDAGTGAGSRRPSGHEVEANSAAGAAKGSAGGAVVPPIRLAGWYPDPRGRHDVRYWDGSRWTFNVGSVDHPNPSGSTSGSDSEAQLLAMAVPETPQGQPARRWRTRLLMAALAFLAATGWGFGIMKAKASSDAPAAPAVTATTPAAK
ncbi:MAG: hypothetical protein JWL70_3053 [Acidimicrobiia bacterium]|nr:hypothetical protein [Acidimicrobiia bacterium]